MLPCAHGRAGPARLPVDAASAAHRRAKPRAAVFSACCARQRYGGVSAQQPQPADMQKGKWSRRRPNGPSGSSSPFETLHGFHGCWLSAVFVAGAAWRSLLGPNRDRKTLPALPAACIQNGTTGGGLHPSAEAVLVLTLPVVRLVCRLTHCSLTDLIRRLEVAAKT